MMHKTNRQREHCSSTNRSRLLLTTDKASYMYNITNLFTHQNYQIQPSNGVSVGRSACGVILAKCLLAPSSQSSSAECAVTRLSHTTTVPGAHFTLAWKSWPLAMWSYKKLRRKSLSSFLKPTIRRLNCGFTYRAFSPVAGWVRTRGWTEVTGARRTMPPRSLLVSACSMPGRVNWLPAMLSSDAQRNE